MFNEKERKEDSDALLNSVTQEEVSAKKTLEDHRIKNSENTENVNGYPYINEFSFKMDASSSEKIMFYKTLMKNC